MFKSKPHGDIVRKLSKKIVDLKKTSLDRFKYLKTLIAIGDGDGFPIESQKEFFEQNYQHAYHVFQDNFLWHIDPERRTKGQRVHKDDFEYLLIVFEKILTFLPNLLRRRWQFNSIRTLLKLLLHSGNTLKLRKDGVRLFIIWYQILQEHNDVENHQIFSKLVTIFQDSESYLSFSDFVSVPTSENPVTPVEIHPLIPAATSDKTSSKVHKFLMESVLTFMVSEVVKVQWDNLEMQELAFRFLFNSFKTYYLNVIFPKFDVNTSVYATSVDHLPEFGTEQSVVGADVLGDCQDVVIRWFTTFVQSSRSLSLPEANKEELPSHESTDLEQEGVGTLKEGDTATLDSKSGTLTNGSLDPVTTTPSSRQNTYEYILYY
ncbi:RALGAPA2 [Bugula neritina]|uniref:RALGAPA2 n=1 Tax=Bugula neritina TaxID=10212 RepID=A0A7J7KH67_BUGNE|nr:RALGAPA2 [Bugula neritina]